MGKWFCCSLYYYEKTEGVPNNRAYNRDETKFLRTFIANKQIAKKGAKEVYAGTEGDKKDGFSAFLYTDADADPQHPFFILQGEVAPNRPQLHSSLKKKSGTVHDNLERAIHEGRLDSWHNSWVMYIEAMMWLVECIGHKGTYHI